MYLFIFLLLISVLIVVHEFGHFIAARRIKVRVEKFSLGFGPEIWKRKFRDTQYIISAIPLGGYVKLAGDDPQEYRGGSDEFLSKPIGLRLQVIFSGPLLNYILGLVCFWIVFYGGYPRLGTKVGSVFEGFGAAEAGLRPQDQILAIDGREVLFWEDLQRIVQKKKQLERVKLLVLRQGERINFDVIIKQKQIDDFLGGRRTVGLIGISPANEYVVINYGFFKSFFHALGRTLEVTAVTYRALWRMIIGRIPLRESVTGLPGIYDLTFKAVKRGIADVLQLMAILNLSLAIFNLLPIPVLDGGHIFFLVIEKLRGRSLSVKTERIVTQIGFAFIVFFAVYVNLNDILRIHGEKIQKFFIR